MTLRTEEIGTRRQTLIREHLSEHQFKILQTHGIQLTSKTSKESLMIGDLVLVTLPSNLNLLTKLIKILVADMASRISLKSSEIG